MKLKVNFTRGEWTAAALLLVVVLGSYLFYYLYPDGGNAPEDLTRYAMAFEKFEKEQERLKDSVEIAYQQRYTHRSYGDTTPASKKAGSVRAPLHGVERINLNTCDSLDLLLLPSVGEKRAALIYKYRERLGGFVSIEQIREVYGMQDYDVDKALEYCYIPKTGVRLISINEAEYKELIAHPYVDAYMAKCILVYRKKNGPIRSLAQLQEITHAYPELVKKLEPYFVF